MGEALSDNLHSQQQQPPRLPRLVFIGAGSQAHAYARPIKRHNYGTIIAICDPIAYKRNDFGARYIWGRSRRRTQGTQPQPYPHQHHTTFESYAAYEQQRRRAVAAGAIGPSDAAYHGADAAVICVLDAQHEGAVAALAPLGLHILCEKPLAPTMEACVRMLRLVRLGWGGAGGRETLFGLGHVLRYSRRNGLLRRLVREERVLGDVVSVEHTEPVGWWHMAHSFVRGNWRRQDTTAPILLTKCCHDIDFLMWLLCSPPLTKPFAKPHLPSLISSSGLRTQFKRARKPAAAGTATNCLSCPIEKDCIYSSRSIYVDRLLKAKDLEWPLKTVVPEIEDVYKADGAATAEKRLLQVLSEDYVAGTTPDDMIKSRPWHGRCVYECDNDVCDDQTVTITWDDDKDNDDGDHRAKSALFHMVAPSEAICARRGVLYGTAGELTYNDELITVHTFAAGVTRTYRVAEEGSDEYDDGKEDGELGKEHDDEEKHRGGHGGGDGELARRFCAAVADVVSGKMETRKAQRLWLGCDLEEIVRSHGVVFAAEKARRERVVVDWEEFWTESLNFYEADLT